MFTLMPYTRYLQNHSRPLQSVFDNFFDRSFSPIQRAFKVNILDKANEYELQAELPGINEEDISISVENDMLTVSADYSKETTDEKKQYTYCERESGYVGRSFSLEGIRQDQITAKLSNGILYITLPKAEPGAMKSSRQIPIETAAGPSKLTE